MLDLMLCATLFRHMVNITIMVVTNSDRSVWARLLKLCAWCGVTLLTHGLELPSLLAAGSLALSIVKSVDWLLLEVTGWLAAEEAVPLG